MEERQDGTKHLQNPPPPDLGGKRKYIRKLLETFEPHQEAMFADLDRQIEESNPDIVSRQFDDLSNQLKKKNKQWGQIMKDFSQVEKTERKIVEASLIALLDEIIALNPTHLALYRQIHSTTRQNTVLKYKRAHLVELLQTMHTMRQEGDWEKIGEKEKNPYEVVLIGERFLCFQFTQQQLRYEPIEDIYVWMKQYRPDFLPVEEAEEEESSPRNQQKPPGESAPLPQNNLCLRFLLLKRTRDKHGYACLCQHTTIAAIFKIPRENWEFSRMMKKRTSHKLRFIFGPTGQNSNFLS